MALVPSQDIVTVAGVCVKCFNLCCTFSDSELRRRAELSYLGVKYAGILPDNICRPGCQYNRRVVARQAEFISDLRRCQHCRKFCYFSMVHHSPLRMLMAKNCAVIF